MTATHWHALQGYGFDSLALNRWTWRRVQMLLGLTTDRDAGISWGTGTSASASAPQTPRGIFRVRKDLQWAPTAERLRADLRQLRCLGEQQSQASDHLDVDVFAWIGWLLSRAEEYGGATDAHGRFQREASIASLVGYQHEPIVDEMASIVRQRFVRFCRDENVGVRVERPWPAGKRAAAWVSHDIDNAEPRPLPVAVRKAAGALLSRDPDIRSRRWHEAQGLLRRPAINPYWHMDDFSRISLAAGSPSTFFVLPHTRRLVLEGARRVRRYDIRQRSVKRLMQRLRSAGFELGLHITYNAHDDSAGIKTDLTIFEAATPSDSGSPGARSHYLRFSVPETWRREEAVGLRYDSSLGWSSGWGFRSGTSLPYRPFDRQRDRHINLWELEVNLMDVAVDASEFLAAARQLVSTTGTFGGCAGILIHPTPWDGRTSDEHLAIHRSLLEDLSAQDIWLATPMTIIEAMEQYETAVTSPTATGWAG